MMTTLACFFKVCEEWGVRLKLEKSEFMQEELEVLGWQVGERLWWLTDRKLAKVNGFKVHDKTSLRGFLGIYNFLRRHVRGGKDQHRALTSLLANDVPWKWTDKDEKQLDDVRAAIAQHLKCGYPLAGWEMILITDSSKFGGGGGIWQWQPQVKGMKATTNNLETQVATICNAKGELVPEKDHCVLVPLGYWSWKWNGARLNYSVWEQELLAGVLLLSSQRRILRMANMVAWLSDQVTCTVFKRGDPPQSGRLLRWWTFLQGFPLHCHHLPGIKNEFPDFLSGEEWTQVHGEAVLQGAVDAFQDMDEQMDLRMQKVPHRNRLLVMQPALEELTSEESEFVEENKEKHTDVPFLAEASWRKFIEWAHESLGHLGWQRTVTWLLCRHWLMDEKSFMDMAKMIVQNCGVCARCAPLAIGTPWVISQFQTAAMPCCLWITVKSLRREDMISGLL